MQFQLNGKPKTSDAELIRGVLLAVRNLPSAICEALGISTQDLALHEFDITGEASAMFALPGIQLEIVPATREFVLHNPAGKTTDVCRVSYDNVTKRKLREAKGFIQEALERNVVDGVSVIQDAMADMAAASA
jgi:hypothetical protein